ncbi:MAG TPA: helix-turn-helix domain-containing protein [Solirubrobacteraceae bacterium]
MFSSIDAGVGEELALKARIGANLRRLRVGSRQSLSELARATAISKATLSGIERGEANPTVQTLAALARALRVPISGLLEEPAEGQLRIVRASSRSAAPERSRLLALEQTQTDGHIEISELILAAGAVERQAPRAAGSRVHLLVLAGKLIAGPQERISELARGDYCSFPADTAHVFEAPAGCARALLCTHTPSRP